MNLIWQKSSDGETTHDSSWVDLHSLSKKISQLEQTQFKKWNLIPIEMEAGAFLDCCIDGAKTKESSLVASLPWSGSRRELRIEEKQFLQQFRWLREEDANIDPVGHDFYQGDEPRWNDIVKELDALLAPVTR